MVHYNVVEMKINLSIVAIVLIAAVALLYYSVSLTSPIVFGDEGFYASTSKWIGRSGLKLTAFT